MEVDELGTGWHAQLVDEGAAQRAKGRQRLRPVTRGGQGLQPLSLQAFVEGVHLQRLRDGGQHVVRPPETLEHVHHEVEHGAALDLESRAPRQVVAPGDVLQGGTPPAREGIGQQRTARLEIPVVARSDGVVGVSAEVEMVEGVSAEVELVAERPGDQQAGVAGPEPSSEGGDEVLELLSGGLRGRVPEGGDETFRGDQAVGVEQQHGEDEPLPCTPERHELPVVLDLHRSEYPKLHPPLIPDDAATTSLRPDSLHPCGREPGRSGPAGVAGTAVQPRAGATSPGSAQPLRQ